MTYLVTLFDFKLQVLKKSPKLAIFCIFNELLSTQNVDVARNVECDFFVIFKHCVAFRVQIEMSSPFPAFDLSAIQRGAIQAHYYSHSPPAKEQSSYALLSLQ